LRDLAIKNGTTIEGRDFRVFAVISAWRRQLDDIRDLMRPHSPTLKDMRWFVLAKFAAAGVEEQFQVYSNRGLN
jgi:hypothetical protein